MGLSYYINRGPLQGYIILLDTEFTAPDFTLDATLIFNGSRVVNPM
jgi:hypothetical protein